MQLQSARDTYVARRTDEGFNFMDLRVMPDLFGRRIRLNLQ